MNEPRVEGKNLNDISPDRLITTSVIIIIFLWRIRSQWPYHTHPLAISFYEEQFFGNKRICPELGIKTNNRACFLDWTGSYAAVHCTP
jgi:hypothetical protein